MVDGGPAAAAGVPDGVVVTKVDDHVIDGAEALVASVRSKAPGDKVTLTYEDASVPARPPRSPSVRHNSDHRVVRVDLFPVTT